MEITNIKLNDGTLMPQLGFGTWELNGQENINNALSAAWEYGYRHIDTAQIYNNEYEIGNFLKETNLKREDLYLTTKVWISNFRSKAEFKQSVHESLRRLGVDKVNMLLLHWAVSKEVSVNAYKWLEEVKEEGLTDSIGVSNFNVTRLEQVLKIAKIKPTVNQVQFDLLDQELEIREWCTKHDIHVQGYSVLKPYLGSSSRINLTDEQKDIVNSIGTKYNKTGAQIVLKFALEENLIIFPKSKTPSRIKQNMELFDFNLSEEDLEVLRSFNNPPKEMKHDEVANGLWDSELDGPLLYDKNFKSENGKYVNDDSVKYER